MTRFQCRSWAVAALSAAWVLVSGLARAERDTFFLGTGRDGALTVSTAGNVINSYAQVTAPLLGGDTSISVSTPTGAGFKSGDLVMVLQTTGLLTVPASGSSSPIALGSTDIGRWELARLGSVSAASGGVTLSLTAPLVYSYAAQVSQVIRVPEYSTVETTAGATIDAMPWDGAKGGIVAFLAQGTVTNNGKILATGAGFRGGQAVNDPAGSLGCTGLDEAAPKGAQKGEGFANVSYGPSYTGRGNVGNGGGGGVCLQAGGGGGSNANAGGQGGYSNNVKDWPGGTVRDVGGLGGVQVQFNPRERLTLGGGGGAGHGANGTAGSGGSGGGIIFVRANALEGTSYFEANGVQGASSSGGDGAGGGGAGGTVYARFATSAACGLLTARGADGGRTSYPDSTTFVGPGGGGGGGMVLLQQTGGTCKPLPPGGVYGTKQNSDPTYGSAYGATSGKPGVVDTTFATGYFVPAVPVLNTPADGAFVNTSYVSGTAQPNATIYVFIDGRQQGTVAVDGFGDYGATLSPAFTDGPHRIEVAVEYQGTWSAPTAARQFTMDATPPAVPVISSPANGSSVPSTTPTLSGTAEPLTKVAVTFTAGAVVTASVDASGRWSATSPLTFGEGSRTVSAQTLDAAGNSSASVQVTFTIDVTPPKTSIFLASSNPSGNPIVSFNLSSTEPGGTFECRLDEAAFTACTSPVTYTLPDGRHTFQARAIDKAGNVDMSAGSAGQFSWVLDTGAPDVSITEKPASLTKATSARFVFGSTDRGSSFQCSLDDASFTSCTSPLDLTGLSDGKHSFKVQAKDLADNVSTAPATWTWTVDVTAPAAPVITAPTDGLSIEDTRPSITGTAEAGSTVRVFIDGTEAGSVSADASGNWSFTPSTALANGSHTVKATATDAVGNVSAESAALTFKVESKQSPGTGGGETESCGCSSPAGDPASALMALAGLAAFVSRRRRQ